VKQAHHKYTIRFAGLPLGSHQFEFHVNETFIQAFHSETDIEKAELHIRIEAERTEQTLQLNINLGGIIHTPCDRCLDVCQTSLSDSQILIYSIESTMKTNQNQDNIIHISPDSDFVILDDIFYDFIILSIPLRKVHDDEPIETSKCNKEMLDIIEKMSTNAHKTQLWDKLIQHQSDN